MAENGTGGFLDVLAAFIFRSAREKGKADDVAMDLTGAHVLNVPSIKHPPLSIMNPGTRAIVEEEADKLTVAVEKLGIKKTVGYVNVKGKDAGPAMQELARKVDHFSGIKHLSTSMNARSVPNAKRTAEEILGEIADKTENWG